MSDSYHFLTDDWVQAARSLGAEYENRIPASPIALRMNVIVTGSPHHDGNVLGHIDTTAGQLTVEQGQLDEPELTVTLDYDTAQAAFVTRDPQTLMQAVFGGKILVEGDASKLVLLQAQPPSEDAIEMYQRLDAMTIKTPPSP